ncbi:E3 ubiquitin-protein ligase NRDP1-like [Pollicipes pollicipes]|uniref:E3 ubiquitin-protein ligase NRDP1-like n=2 Tax=Pollicipes pollicipes TaxID=41117 RepID=UPI00188578FE|nr:E3 ubiquitin-protein ligase NRDP1-like [Pollicipes pollicipes]XP_037090407.1 E3 ubiquitin-protein ligase NRDP1-like [Pollicipes pollicipes]XP_037090408.1 E3 ubiquitin-protein ligase NRDP1-like [Pollicipes pollicipes]XP_037090410.1 E3 ubiquitin-protein ligase NRDP1-like [Pollicipes pollicipes]XP_037090411.1 E3 ubiquitin-protein ligase NRDP1-like [Pollicipes pollicipes]XP_037090412.1 E3 ubiquitin-protein ligase NRDP1-like [Pollicipes pollicipes]
MGYEIARFVSSDIDKDLICSICMCVLENPAETPCEHSFCERCIKEWLRFRGRCPLDRVHINANQLYQPSRMLINQLGRLVISCDFKSEGCDQTMPLEVLAAHRLKCPCNPRPNDAPEQAARPALPPRHDAGAYAQQQQQQEEESVDTGVAVGLVALAGIVGTVVAGVMGYQRGRSRGSEN